MRNLLLPLSLVLLGSPAAVAQGALTGDEIVANVNAREDGEHVTRRFVVELTDRNGRIRTEETIAQRRYFDDEKRTIIFYTEPNSVRQACGFAATSASTALEAKPLFHSCGATQ